ncbi:MAG: halocyanin domain-containing protein [Halobacteria archaeon]
MNRETSVERRRYLLSFGSILAVATSGCLSGNGETSGNRTKDPYGGWFVNVPAYNGTVDDTGDDHVKVKVGAGNRGRSFIPSAVEVSQGTTVTWRWTGVGGRHNVKSVDGEFKSEYSSDEGYTFSHQFDETGVYRYVCVPHRRMGMKGVIKVTDEG